MRSALSATLSAGLVAVGLLVSGNVVAAGFDCAKAGTKIEKQICANPTLDQLDFELNRAYYAAIQIDGVRQGQRDWVKTIRNNAPNDDIMIIVYNQRIAELEKMVAPAVVEPAKVEPVAEPVKVEIKPTMQEVMKYTEAATALSLAKACDQKDLFEYDYNEYRDVVLDEIKADLKDRYSSEVMRVSYQKVYGNIMQTVVKSPAKLSEACHAINTTLDSMVEEAEAEEMEF
ncbi:MAG: lysozyme inhibitor LprI family protein [Clostridium sp.]